MNPVERRTPTGSRSRPLRSLRAGRVQAGRRASERPMAIGGLRYARALAVVILLLAVPILSGRALGTSGPANDIEVRGVIVDELGRGIRSARVQLLWDQRILASATSDERGDFLVRTEADVDGPVTLRAQRLGYESVEVDLEPLPAQELRVELVPAPIPLPGVEVVGTGGVCDASDSGAVEFWRAARTLHRLDLDTMGVASYTLALTDTLEADTPLDASLGERRLVPGQRSSAPLLRFSWDRRVEREGYAFPVRRTNRNGSYPSWSYAPLEADFSGHFLSSGFARWHHLSTLTRTPDGGYDLRFCPVSDDRPAVSGRLRFSPDSLIIRAEWAFRTPEPNEEAGGWAVFSEPPADRGPRLLPSESLTWKLLPDGSVQRRAQWYEEWHVTPGDSVPFLPSR